MKNIRGILVFILTLGLATQLGLGGIEATAATTCDFANYKAQNSRVKNLSSYDVVIYGGTPSGVAAARSAAELQKRVLLLSESNTFGGAISNGLSATDVGLIHSNVGLAKTYLDDLRRYYRTDSNRSEPRVAECIFRNWLKSPLISLGTEIQLDTATFRNSKITSITLHSKANPDSVQVFGKTFIDASYAGDLMFASGAKTHLGMTDFYSYGEVLTGKRRFTKLFSLKKVTEIAKAKKAFEQIPHVIVKDVKDSNTAMITQGLPSFTYRLCITKEKANRIAFSKDANYDSYAPAWRIFMNNHPGYKSDPDVTVNSNGTILTQLWRIAKLPNGKYDLNTHYSSFTNLTMPREYFDKPETRPEILSKFAGYLQSFLWFIQNDPSVPDSEQRTLANFGLCADEFVDNGGWPEQPYLREGRRLVGKKTLTTADIFGSRYKDDAVAVGSYPLDSKSTIFTYINGSYLRDRSELVSAPMYEIPLSAMIPKAGPTNLIVSVGISASPSAFASLRMEPQFIQLGQAAGIAAALASKSNGEISNDLAKRVRASLARANGFMGIQTICKGLKTSNGYLFTRFCLGQVNPR